MTLHCLIKLQYRIAAIRYNLLQNTRFKSKDFLNAEVAKSMLRTFKKTNSESLDFVDYWLFTLEDRVISITSTQIHFLDLNICLNQRFLLLSRPLTWISESERLWEKTIVLKWMYLYSLKRTNGSKPGISQQCRLW